MPITKNYANTILSSLFSNAYIGLSTTTPNVDGAGVTEPLASSGYNRVAASGASFVTSNGSITNNTYLYFPEASASWGTITHVCVFDGNSPSSKLRYFGALTVSKEIEANSVPLFRPQSINISVAED